MLSARCDEWCRSARPPGTARYGDRPRRISLRPLDAREGRQRGSARGQMQKSPAGKFHSITSSARPSSVSGTVRPSALAVLRLMINSTFVDCWTGRSAGFSPLRMRPV